MGHSKSASSSQRGHQHIDKRTTSYLFWPEIHVHSGRDRFRSVPKKYGKLSLVFWMSRRRWREDVANPLKRGLYLVPCATRKTTVGQAAYLVAREY